MKRETAKEALDLLRAFWPKRFGAEAMGEAAALDTISDTLWNYDDRDIIQAIKNLAASQQKAPTFSEIDEACKHVFDTYVHGDNKGDDQLWVLWDEYVPELCGRSETHYTDFVMTYRKVKQLFSPMKIEELKRKRKLEVFNG